MTRIDEDFILSSRWSEYKVVDKKLIFTDSSGDEVNQISIDNLFWYVHEKITRNTIQRKNLT